MGFFDALVSTATLPLAVVADTLTLGGLTNGEKKPYTLQKLDKIVEDLTEDL